MRWHYGRLRYVPPPLLRATARRSGRRSCSPTSRCTPSSRSSSAHGARAAARRPRRQLGSHGRQGDRLAAPAPLHRAERRHARRSRALPRHRAGSASSSRAGRRPTSSTASVRARSTKRSCAGSVSTRRGPSSSSWATRRRTHRTSSGSSSGSSSGGRRAAPTSRFSLLFRPHPRDREWRERFAAALSREGAAVQEPSFTDLETLAVLLQHGDVRRHECRHDPARRARQRPADGLRPLRRGRARGRELGAQERQRRALPSADGVRRVLPGGALRGRRRRNRARTRAARRARAERARAAREVVGEVDGRAAERVADAIVDALS